MPRAHINGIQLYYESTGEGFPLVLAHEFAGDFRSWEPQVRYFSRRYRVITYNARGYPPSEVPTDEGAYSQEMAVEDLRGLAGPSRHRKGAHLRAVHGRHSRPELRHHVPGQGAITHYCSRGFRLYRRGRLARERGCKFARHGRAGHGVYGQLLAG